MPICRECGLGVPPGYDACPKCGRPLTAAATPAPEAESSSDDLEAFYVSATPSAAAATTSAAPIGISETACSVCGRRPAAVLSLRRQVGMIFVIRFARLRAPFCRTHGRAAASEYLRRTMVEGWWGFIAFFLNFYSVYVNTRALGIASALAEPSGEAAEVKLSQPLPEHLAGALGESDESRAVRGSVLRTVAVAIGIGIVGLVVVRSAVDTTNDTIAHRLGIGLASTLLVYVAVGILVYTQVHRRRIRPSIVQGKAGNAVLWGVLVGGGVALVIGMLISLLSGHLTSDPRILEVIYEGDKIQLIVVVLISVAAAPFIEETLFRGLLVESLRSRGRTSAVLTGAVAFSLWHLNPSALRYYILMGFLFGYLYWRFGLTGSISAHAAFNGTLTVLAFLSIGHAALALGNNGVTVELPAGWHQIGKAADVFDLAAESPLGAGFLVGHSQAQATPGAEFGPEASLPSRDRLPPGATDVRDATVDGGAALRYTLRIHGDDATVVAVVKGARRYIVTLIPVHSEKAAQQMEQMLQSLHLPG